MSDQSANNQINNVAYTISDNTDNQETKSVQANDTDKRTDRYSLSIKIVTLAILYYITARLGLQLQFETTQASPVWPPSGLAFAAVLIYGYRMGYGIFMGALAANLVDFYIKSGIDSFNLTEMLIYPFSHLTQFGVAVWIALGNTAEALVGLYLIDRFVKSRIPFATTTHVVWFIGIVLLMCMVSATNGVISLVISGILPSTLFSVVWFTWWSGDAAGTLILAPCLIIWYQHYQPDKRIPLPAKEFVIANFMLLFLCMMTFGGLADITFFNAQAYLLLPVLLVVVLFCGNLTASFAVVLVSSIAILGTVNGLGPFVREAQNESLVLLQGFVAVVATTMLLLDAALSERASAMQALEDANLHLEKRVESRTRDLTQANKELARSNQELDDFCYIASHDLKEPLRGIENQVSFILEDYSDQLPHGALERLHKLPPITQHLEQLISALLHFSRVGRVDLQMDKINIDKLIKEIIESLEGRLVEEKIDVRIPSPLPAVVCDGIKIGEVFRNLITNSMKYNDKDEKWLEIGVTKIANKGQCFYVKDNGIGIRERHLDKIFQIFKRLHSKEKFGGGTGAGMTIVKKIVEKHQGEIWVESVYGEGSSFYFTLEGLNNDE